MLALTLLFLLALSASAVVTAAEVSLFSLGDSRIRTLLEEGFRGSRTLAAVRGRPERLLLLLRLSRALADGSAGVLGGVIGYLTAGAVGAALGLAAVVALLLLAGQLLPMRFAARSNVRLALLIAPVAAMMLRATGPLLRLMEPLTRGLSDRPYPLLAVSPEEEVRQLTTIGHGEGVIEDAERQLIERAFRLDESRARDIMTPRVDIFAWRDAQTLHGIAQELQTVPYSRVPIFGETIDDTTGVLYIRDAYQALLTGREEIILRDLAREPLIVPGSIPLTQLLKEFQARRIHLALVVDEYGGIDGLVTLEDILEELVGEIVDETDIADEPIVRISRSEILARGDADLREINHYFNTSFPLLEQRSLNGYLLEELGRVPETGEMLARDGIEIEILEASEIQVLRARLERIAPAIEGGRDTEEPLRSLPRAGPRSEAEGGDEVDEEEEVGADPSGPGPERTGTLPGRATRDDGTDPHEPPDTLDAPRRDSTGTRASPAPTEGRR